jgi:hypothetical protein
VTEPRYNKKQSVQGQISELIVIFAGDKIGKVTETAKKLMDEGKSHNRAFADALEKHKCPNTFPDTQDYQ